MRDEHERWFDRLAAAELLDEAAPVDVLQRQLLVAQDGAIRRWMRAVSTIDELRSEMVSAVCVVALAATDPSASVRERVLDELRRQSAAVSADRA